MIFSDNTPGSIIVIHRNSQIWLFVAEIMYYISYILVQYTL